MKKRMFLLILLIIISILATTVVSAKYICSDGSEIIRDVKEIKELDRKGVNGIGIAVFKADEFSALGGIKAEIIVDAKKISLSNETPSEKVEFAGTVYTVTLVNATDKEARIKIDGSSDDILEGEYDTIKGLKVVLIEAGGEYPATMNAEIIIGSKMTTLSSVGTLNEVVKIEEKDYLIELASASDTDAIISVSKCKTGNLTEEKEIEEIVSKNITLETNETINETIDTEKSEVNETKKEVGEVCKEDNDCISNKCKEEKCVKLGFFQKLINWFINLFK